MSIVIFNTFWGVKKKLPLSPRKLSLTIFFFTLDVNIGRIKGKILK